MMKANLQKKMILTLLAVLVAATAVLAWMRRSEPVPEGQIQVTWGDASWQLPLTQLEADHVQGELVNGKGEHVPVDAPGVELFRALETLDIDPATVEAVTVTAEDGFSAQLTGEELRTSEKVWLSLEKEQPVLVVFGDSNAKRHVRGVISVVLS